jgi:hypothetical protein
MSTKGAYVWTGEKVGNGSPLHGFSVDNVKCIYSAKVIGAPVETGQESFDNKVIEPYRVIVTGHLVIDDESGYQTTLKKLKEILNDRKFRFYSVSDGASFYERLILTELPVERSVDAYDFYSIELTFVQAMLIQSNSALGGGVRNSEDSPTIDYGRSMGAS